MNDYIVGLITGMAAGILLFVLGSHPSALGDPWASERKAEQPAIVRGAPRAEVEKHFHFGLTTKAGYVPGGQMYEWQGKGWRVILQLADELNHRLPGHPV